MFGLPAAALVVGILAGCTPNYSPNTYAATATQQANKVERAVVIGFRQVKISTSGTPSRIHCPNPMSCSNSASTVPFSTEFGGVAISVASPLMLAA